VAAIQIFYIYILSVWMAVTIDNKKEGGKRKNE